MISFRKIRKGHCYSRPSLAKLWDYASYQAIARGVVTPAGDNKIILFVTEHKQSSLEPYRDLLVGSTLEWEGPTDHFAEERMIASKSSDDEIHLFYRERHHSEFLYLGLLELLSYQSFVEAPSKFRFRVL